jgi:hypothetical protein
MKICLMLVPFDLAGTPLKASCMEIAGSDRVWWSCAPMFFSNRLVSGESGAMLFYLLPSWDMFRSMVNSETGNVMKAES